MLSHCWASVADGGAAVIQRWFYVSCLLRRETWTRWQATQSQGAESSEKKNKILSQCWFNAGPASQTVDQHYTKHWLKCWNNVGPALIQSQDCVLAGLAWGGGH